MLPLFPSPLMSPFPPLPASFSSFYSSSSFFTMKPPQFLARQSRPFHREFSGLRPLDTFPGHSRDSPSPPAMAPHSASRHRDRDLRSKLCFFQISGQISFYSFYSSSPQVLSCPSLMTKPSRLALHLNVTGCPLKRINSLCMSRPALVLHFFQLANFPLGEIDALVLRCPP